IPVFVKAGSILPMVPDFYSTDDYPSALEIHYYPKKYGESKASLYEDDGETFSAIEDEAYQYIEFAASNAEKLLHFIVESDSGEYQGKSEKRELAIVIHQCIKKPKQVILNGHLLKLKKRKSGDYIWDKENKRLTIKLDWENQDLDLRILK
ncbi:MAG: DUF5110 domain-containing protein, partial [Bacteroidales bacterium]|nr:DUF5110 domain-containing protein [Bacteroidales bacterium]